MNVSKSSSSLSRIDDALNDSLLKILELAIDDKEEEDFTDYNYTEKFNPINEADEYLESNFHEEFNKLTLLSKKDIKNPYHTTNNIQQLYKSKDSSSQSLSYHKGLGLSCNRLINVNPLSTQIKQNSHLTTSINSFSNSTYIDNFTTSNKENSNYFALGVINEAEKDESPSPIKAPRVKKISFINVNPKACERKKKNTLQVPPNCKSKTSSSSSQQLVYENLQPSEIISLLPILVKEQAGCRFLQSKISEIQYYSEKYITPYIMEYILDVITNKFGNFLIQRIIEVVNSETFKTIFHIVIKNFLYIATNEFGSRVIQKIIERKLSMNDAMLYMNSLKYYLHMLIINKHAYHILVKTIQTFNEKYVDFIYFYINSNLLNIANDSIGCCALQKLIEFAHFKYKPMIITQIIQFTQYLMIHPHGNYVLGYVISLKNYKSNKEILDLFVFFGLREICVNKFSSVLVEKLLENSNSSMRREIINLLLIPNVISVLLLDNTGCSVLFTLLNYCSYEECDYISKQIDEKGKTTIGKLMNGNKLLSKISLLKGQQ